VRRLSEGSGDEMEFSNNDLIDADLPAGVTSNKFSRYVAIDRDVQTTADITDKELCIGQQSVAGDAEVKWARRQTTMPVSRHPLPSCWLLPYSLGTVRSYLEAAGVKSCERPCCKPSYA